MSKPVVLIAEELSPATVEALGPDFDIRHTDVLIVLNCWLRYRGFMPSSFAQHHMDPKLSR